MILRKTEIALDKIRVLIRALKILLYFADLTLSIIEDQSVK